MKYSKVIIGGITATAVMTVFMLLGPLFNMPRIDAGAMLGTLFNDNQLAGWTLHFLIGIIFAFFYALIFNGWLPVINHVARGAIYGIIVLVFSQAAFTVINLAGFFSWEMKEGMAMTIFGYMLACFIYGAVLGGVMKQYQIDNGLDWEKKRYFWRYLKPKKA
ncbi:MAG: DUF6789 family protein [Bacteroidota bacterium]